MSHLLKIAVQEMDLETLSSAHENKSLLQYYPEDHHHHQAFRYRSQSIKLRNPNRVHCHRRRQNHGRRGRSSLAHQRRPSMYSTKNKSSRTKKEEKEGEVRDDRDNTDRDHLQSSVSSKRRERQVLLQALASDATNNEEAKAEHEKIKSQDRKDGFRRERTSSVRTKLSPNHQPILRRARSMDPGLVRGRGGEDQGEDQPSAGGRAVLRRSQSLEGPSNRKKSTRRKNKVPKKISSISSVDTTMMERDIWIECLWFKKIKRTKRKKKTYFKSFRTQKCFKRPPEGARTVLYLEHFFDSDEELTCCSPGYSSDCGDSMECLYQEYNTTTTMKQQQQQQECSSMTGIPSEIVPVFRTCTKKNKKRTKPRRIISKRWRALVRFMKVTRASF